MIGMRYQPERRKIRPFCPICNLFIFGGAMKEEEEGLAPPLLPEEAKEEDEVPPLCGAGEMLVTIPFLCGERHVLIDPLQQAMIIPLHFLWDDFLDELGHSSFGNVHTLASHCFHISGS